MGSLQYLRSPLGDREVHQRLLNMGPSNALIPIRHFFPAITKLFSAITKAVAVDLLDGIAGRGSSETYISSIDLEGSGPVA